MRTDAKLDDLCDALTVTYGDLHKAARNVGLSPFFVVQWIKDDKVAAERIQEAQRVGYLGLESVAMERATVGVETGVYFKGERIGAEYKPSDTLLVKIMEAKLPEYNRKEGGNTFNAPVQVNIMPRATNFEEWSRMKDLTLANRARDTLPAPTKVPEILQGDYVVVEERPLAGLGSLL